MQGPGRVGGLVQMPPAGRSPAGVAHKRRVWGTEAAAPPSRSLQHVWSRHALRSPPPACSCAPRTLASKPGARLAGPRPGSEARVRVRGRGERRGSGACAREGLGEQVAACHRGRGQGWVGLGVPQGAAAPEQAPAACARTRQTHLRVLPLQPDLLPQVLWAVRTLDGLQRAGWHVGTRRTQVGAPASPPPDQAAAVAPGHASPAPAQCPRLPAPCSSCRGNERRRHGPLSLHSGASRSPLCRGNSARPLRGWWRSGCWPGGRMSGCRVLCGRAGREGVHGGGGGARA